MFPGESRSPGFIYCAPGEEGMGVLLSQENSGT
jgi:hypothetical protein